MMNLLDFAVITIFARETLEGGIIIGEYRTVIQRSNWNNPDMTRKQALREVTVAAVGAGILALFVCAAVAIPLAVLSKDFNADTAILIEGVSKIVAAVCILGLSLKMPKFFGLYYSKSQVKRMQNGETLDENEDPTGMTRRSIRFNVAWNIWREVAECGVFLIPFFLSGDEIVTIPLSALVGILAGGAVCIGILYANRVMTNTTVLTIFTVSIFLLLSSGLFTDGLHKFEKVYGSTEIVYQIEGDFWSINRLPMTIFKPFGYSDTRTVLQMVSFWSWLFFSLAIHYLKWKKCYKRPSQDDTATKVSGETAITHDMGKQDLTHDMGKQDPDASSGDLEAGVEQVHEPSQDDIER
jgi:high-affinity iron transporter